MKGTFSTELAVATVVAFSVMTGAAAAAPRNDYINYNGSYCKAQHGSDAVYFVHDVSGIRNVSGQTRAIFCPIISDQVENTSGLRYIYMYWTAANERDTITCFLQSRQENGEHFQLRNLRKTGSGRFTTIDGRLGFDLPLGSYSLWCYLPAGGILNTIRIAEVEQD